MFEAVDRGETAGTVAAATYRSRHGLNARVRFVISGKETSGVSWHDADTSNEERGVLSSSNYLKIVLVDHPAAS